MSTSTIEQWLLWWPGRGLAPGPDPAGGRLLAADSWLVRDGRVLGLEHHVRRFSHTCETAGTAARTLDDYWTQVVAALPRDGSWFPRTELHDGGVLGLRLRPAPPLRDSIRMLPWPEPDPRRAPLRKGPDLELLAELKTRAGERGADDALLTTEDGLVLESSTASLLWWEGDELCLPDAESRMLPGVTAKLIVRQARDLGVTVRRRHATLADLHEREAWLTNALHGIRPVTAWVGSACRPGPPERIPLWRQLLASLARPLPDRGPDPHR